MDIPDRIYLQIESDGEPTGDWTHCVDRVNDSDVEYVRSSINEKLLEACEAEEAFWQHYARCGKCAGALFCPDAAELLITARTLRLAAIAAANGKDGE